MLKLLLVVLLAFVGPNPRLSMTIRPVMMLSEGDITATVRVARNEANRGLVLSWQCDCGATGESARQVDGLDAPITHLFTLHDQPPGHWVFVASLFGPGGKLIARTSEEIQGVDR